MHNLCRMLYQQALWTLQEMALTSCGPKGFGLHSALLSWDSFFFPSWDEMVLASWPWVINRDTHWVWASGYSQPQPLSPQVKLCRMWSWKASGRGSVFLHKPVRVTFHWCLLSLVEKLLTQGQKVHASDHTHQVASLFPERNLPQQGCVVTHLLQTRRRGKEKKQNRGLPGGPVVKTPHSQCREHGFDPWSGN